MRADGGYFCSLKYDHFLISLTKSWSVGRSVLLVGFRLKNDDRHKVNKQMKAAEQFEVSGSSAIRWVQRFRENGTGKPSPRRVVRRHARPRRDVVPHRQVLPPAPTPRLIPLWHRDPVRGRPHEIFEHVCRL